MINQTFINLPVTDLGGSITFFTSLGFKFNPKFTDENATCMILNDNSFVMLLTRNFFEKFTKKAVADAAQTTEVLVALMMESRKKVDELVNSALKAGGSSYSDPIDMGYMYQRSFADLDGHQWEIGFMDESKFPEK